MNITHSERSPAIEKVVTHIWEELLRVEGIGRHDNFFDLGGTSLLAVQMVERLQERYGFVMQLVNVFGCCTVALLAEAIESGLCSQADPAKSFAYDVAQYSEAELRRLLQEEEEYR